MSITVVNCHQVKNWALSPRKCCAVILPCSRLISVAMWCPLNFGEKAPVLGFFFFSFFKGCVVVCHPSVSGELHLSLCGLFCYLEGTVVQCRRWKPCDSSRICVAVVNPSPSPPFFPPDMQAQVSFCAFCRLDYFLLKMWWALHCMRRVAVCSFLQ